MFIKVLYFHTVHNLNSFLILEEIVIILYALCICRLHTENCNDGHSKSKIKLLVDDDVDSDVSDSVCTIVADGINYIAVNGKFYIQSFITIHTLVPAFTY